jgi:hypothetical protein
VKKMSYDRVYLCRTLDPNTWSEKRQMESEGHLEQFNAEADCLYMKGDFVVLVAGANFMFDELYLFEQPEDAERFYETDFVGRESIIDDKPCGFEKVALYRSGKCVAQKEQPSSGEQSGDSLEQSKNGSTSTDIAVESDLGDLPELD